MRKTINITSRIVSRSRNTQIVINEIKSFPLLTASEELELLKEYKRTQCPKIKERVFRANMRFVLSVARSYTDHRFVVLSVDDLIQIAGEGLSVAIDRFDPETGNKLISYAAHWMKQQVLKAKEGKANLIRSPKDRARIYKEIRAIENTGEKATVEMLTERLRKLGGKFKSMKPETVRMYLYMEKPKSLESKAMISSGGFNDDGKTLGSTIKDNSYNADALLEDDGKYEGLYEGLSYLTKREQLVLTLFFGLGDELPKSLDDIAPIIGRTREMVRQIKNKALKKLRMRLNKTGV